MIEAKVRLAQKSDKEAVLAFCKNTWKNQKDFVEAFWDKWITDPEGCLFVATIEDTPVAIIKVDILSNFEAWWKALRVDPYYRRQGLSKILDSHVTRYLVENNIIISRCCVYSDNEIMVHIMSGREREKVGSYLHYQAEAINSQNIQLIELNLDDEDFIWSEIANFKLLDENQKLYASLITKFQKLTSELLKERLSKEKVWGLKQNNRLLSIAIESYSEIYSQELFYIGYIDGTTKESLNIILHELRKLAHCKGYKVVRSIFPSNNIFKTSLALANYRNLSETKALLYQWKNIYI